MVTRWPSTEELKLTWFVKNMAARGGGGGGHGILLLKKTLKIFFSEKTIKIQNRQMH